MAEEFQYEDGSLGDDWRLAEGGEDLEATLKAIQTRAKATARPGAASNARQPETVDNFLRNFLLHAGMKQTLEWSEMEQRGPVDAGRVGVVPDVYTDNQRLDMELKHEYRRAATAAAQALVEIQRSRDPETSTGCCTRGVLIEDMRRLKVQCDSYEPALQKMNGHQAGLKVSEREKVKSAQHIIQVSK